MGENASEQCTACVSTEKCEKSVDIWKVKGAAEVLSGRRPEMGRHHTKLLLMTFNPINPQWIIHFNYNKTLQLQFLGLCLFVPDNHPVCPKISIRLIISYASPKDLPFLSILCHVYFRCLTMVSFALQTEKSNLQAHPFPNKFNVADVCVTEHPDDKRAGLHDYRC